MFRMCERLPAGNAIARRVGVAAACALVLAGCSVKVGDQVVDIFGGARPASPGGAGAPEAPPLPSPSLPPPPPIPVPSPPPVTEDPVRPERLPPSPAPAIPPPAPPEVYGFISADRVELRPCPDQSARCGTMATLRFNEEVRVLRLDPNDWAFVRVPRLNQNGYILRTHVAPTRQTRPAAASPPDDPQDRAGKESRGAGERKLQDKPREELVK
jgi:hypothetical protein